MSSGTKSSTSPAPARNAPLAVMSAAPTNPFEPATTRDAPALILVGAEFPARDESGQGGPCRHDFVPGAACLQVGQRPHDNAPDEIDRGVGDKPMFGEPDRDGEIGHDGIGIDFAGVAVQTARKIDREDDSVLLVAKAIKLARGRADRLAQEPLGPDAEKSIEDDSTGGSGLLQRRDCRRR